jgi:hypothetical protein
MADGVGAKSNAAGRLQFREVIPPDIRFGIEDVIRSLIQAIAPGLAITHVAMQDTT